MGCIISKLEAFNFVMLRMYLMLIVILLRINMKIWNPLILHLVFHSEMIFVELHQSWYLIETGYWHFDPNKNVQRQVKILITNLNNVAKQCWWRILLSNLVHWNNLLLANRLFNLLLYFFLIYDRCPFVLIDISQ
jgi:hypothetical protein